MNVSMSQCLGVSYSSNRAPCERTRKKGRPQRTGPLVFVPFRLLRALRVLEIECHIEPREARLLDRRRPPQPGAVVAVRLVVSSLGVRVDDVIEIDADVGALAAEPEDLRKAHVERVQALLVDLTVE